MKELTLLMDMHPELAMAVTVISVVSVYVCLKTVLWWIVFGTVGLCRKDYTFRQWLGYTKWGLLGLLALILVDAVLWFGFNPDNVVYTYTCWGLFVLAVRIAWREFFTAGGFLRGDWSFSNPELRFFAWNTLNPFFFLKVFSSPFAKSNNNPKNDTPWGSWGDAIYTYEFYRQSGY